MKATPYRSTNNVYFWISVQLLFRPFKLDKSEIFIRSCLGKVKPYEKSDRYLKKLDLRTPPTKIAKNGDFGTKIVGDPRRNFKKFFF